eukprot:NODE_3025_length_992_cov_31.615058_g2526_i0.p1 GENE.NODE_3025_length_992_cov_31.615058_g2526_i0~~NODE_3025_length_992_cov_31.615058_g2526_i0.p1  ORF type:complete len:207 (-),score=57.02 NODE_3025_length_992_cov_31.615058_g2526_i0:84-704(-)
MTQVAPAPDADLLQDGLGALEDDPVEEPKQKTLKDAGLVQEKDDVQKMFLADKQEAYKPATNERRNRRQKLKEREEKAKLEKMGPEAVPPPQATVRTGSVEKPWGAEERWIPKGELESFEKCARCYMKARPCYVVGCLCLTPLGSVISIALHCSTLRRRLDVDPPEDLDDPDWQNYWYLQERQEPVLIQNAASGEKLIDLTEKWCL